MEQARPWTDFHRAHRDLLTEGVTLPLLADPLAKDWTALQTWDADRARGAVAVFRQQGADATRTVALKGVPAGRRFDLLEAPSGRVLGRVTSAELQQGLPVSLPRDGATLLLVVPVAGS